MARRPTDHQSEILDGLRAGRRLVGPVPWRRLRSARRETPCLRPWGWQDGRPVHAQALAALVDKGVVAIHQDGTTREARLSDG